MINCDILIEAGYREFRDSISLANRCFQKRVWSPSGDITLYFIDIYYYQFEQHVSYALKMHFSRDSKMFPFMEISMNIDHSIATIPMIADCARDIFESNVGVPYQYD